MSAASSTAVTEVERVNNVEDIAADPPLEEASIDVAVTLSIISHYQRIQSNCCF